MNRFRTYVTLALVTLAPVAVVVATAAPRVHM
jgi:hypothetical protein